MKGIDFLDRLFAPYATAILLGAAVVNAEQAPESEIAWAARQFFEERVEPIFKAACYECHSHAAEHVKGGLYLDSRAGWQLGGDSGQVIVPGNPEASLLWRAINHLEPDLEMPPKGAPLDQAQRDVVEKWIRFGAVDPRVADLSANDEPAERHWAFQPVVKPEVPEVARSTWIRTPVDAFVLKQLEDRGMQPSPQAKSEVLIRRLYFDLTGLPPEYDEVERFRADPSAQAYVALVDRLLASPQYGERWARHWLDVARYADTKGYVFQEERRFPYSYTYRDYVIDAFNRDLPYDRFVVEQIAADQLEGNDDPRGLAGMGFLTLGRRFLNNQHDIIDDRIDVVTRGLMGLTVSCARCHDHKYDPIPTADYYSLYGVFASSTEPTERPLLSYDATDPRFLEYDRELARLKAEWDHFRTSNQEAALSEARRQSGEYLQVLYDARTADRSETENLVRERKLGPVIAFRWQSYLADRSSGFDPVFTPWFEMTREEPGQENRGVVRLTALLEEGESGAGEINPLLGRRLREEKPQTVSELASLYGELLAEIEEAWQNRPEDWKAFPDAEREMLRQVLYSEGAPTTIPLSQATQLLDVPTQQKIRALKRDVDRLPATHPGAPARAMALVDRMKLVEPVVFLRGKAGARGPRVPRQFLELVEGEDRTPFSKDRSGRLELAEAIVSADNPLTSRVIVNRVWRHHFGRPLVDTPSDFGIRAEPPSHPALLDYLASRLVGDGWSLKRLHRMLLLSHTYQQASDSDEWHAAKDPENRYFWRMNRRRLELEPMRDTLLAVSGRLDTTMGGQPVEIAHPPHVPRRTIYGFIERQNLPSLFRTFDLASPDNSSSGRFETIVPQQALYMVNSPFVQDLARHLADSLTRESSEETGVEEQVTRMYRRVLQRNPNRKELSLARAFLASQEASVERVQTVPDWQYGYGGVDRATGRLRGFIRLPTFHGQAWKGSQDMPDEKLGWTMLNAKGGHPGGTSDMAVIRRWTAPYSGTFSVEGRLSHGSEKGDGVRAWLVSDRDGIVAQWKAQNGVSETFVQGLSVAAGSTLDFVVDANGDSTYDSFNWRIVIRSPDAPLLSDRRYWNSEEDFDGPEEPIQPLSPLARLGQVLLMSNECVFVD